MTINKLASKIAKIEGKKSEVSIGNIREILGIISDILYMDALENSDIYMCLYQNGKKRANKNAKR